MSRIFDSIRGTPKCSVAVKNDTNEVVSFLRSSLYLYYGNNSRMKIVIKPYSTGFSEKSQANFKFKDLD